MKRILITGATGLLGCNLTKICCSRNYQVTILVRKKSNTDYFRYLPVQIIFGDISNQSDVSDAIARQDYVIHAAGATGQNNISFEEYERINLTATRHVASACLKHGVKRLIYVSTANCFGPGSRLSPGTELNGFSLFKANSSYINTKYLAQQWILEQVAKKALPAVVVNPTFMLGAFDLKPSSGQIVLYGMNKKLLFYPPGGKNFVHVKDVCEGILQALNKGEAGDCYLLAGENLSYGEFFKKLQRITHKKQIQIKIPAFMLKSAGALNAASHRFFGTNHALTGSAAFLLCTDNYYSAVKSVERFGLNYTPAQEAISEAYDWFMHPEKYESIHPKLETVC
jgi:dihydroflavonol-4-reductase